MENNQEKDYAEKSGIVDVNNIKVLTYHRIVDNELLRRIHWSYIGSSQLRRHLELINTWGFTPITFNDYHLAMKGEIRLPKRPIIITFEHAYRRTFDFAFPILKEFGMNGVVFAIGDRTKVKGDWEQHTGLLPEEFADNDQLNAMRDAGFEIGSHSMTHVDLTSVPDARARDEIRRSKEVLESVLGTEVLSFSYPYGSVDRRLKEMVRVSGYRFACGIDTGSPHFGEDPYDIHRITITSSTNTLSFALKLLTHYEQTEWFGGRPTETIRDPWEEYAGAVRSQV